MLVKFIARGTAGRMRRASCYLLGDLDSADRGSGVEEKRKLAAGGDQGEGPSLSAGSGYASRHAVHNAWAPFSAEPLPVPDPARKSRREPAEIVNRPRLVAVPDKHRLGQVLRRIRGPVHEFCMSRPSSFKIDPLREISSGPGKIFRPYRRGSFLQKVWKRLAIFGVSRGMFLDLQNLRNSSDRSLRSQLQPASRATAFQVSWNSMSPVLDGTLGTKFQSWYPGLFNAASTNQAMERTAA